MLLLALGLILTSNSFAKTLIVKDFKRQNFDLEKFSNQTVIVNFWTSWCEFCRKELQRLETIREKYPVKKVEIIAINLDYMDDDRAYKIAKNYSFRFAKYTDATTDFKEPENIPQTFIIKNGKILKEDDLENF